MLLWVSLITAISRDTSASVQSSRLKRKLSSHNKCRASKKRIIFSWGSGNQGQLGLGSEMQSLNIPTEITVLQEEDVTQIAAAGPVSAALTANGQVFTWGRTKKCVFGGD